ncbi:MAG: ATP-binding protein [Anaerolineae bacterium]|nr:ATP-binding protein [Anaerolineae bacterium]
MKQSLQGKLIFSYLIVALVTVLLFSLMIRLSSGQSLMNLVVEQQTALLKESVQTYYESNGSLDGFFEYFQKTNPEVPDHPKPAQPGASKSGPRDVRGLHGLVDSAYHALIPTLGYQIGQVIPEEKIQQKIAVDVNGETIAWILPDNSFQFKLSSEEELFLQRINYAIFGTALAGIFIAVLMGFLLANGLLKPIRRLTTAAQSLARGQLEQQVPVTSQDEMGLLTSTFNQMSSDLAQVDQQRKRLTADITHDLSTPLQIVSGYIEMLEEGEVTLTAQRIEIIKTELDHLRRLVNDLTTLSQVEAGVLEIQKSPVNPAVLLERIFYAYQPITARQNVQLELAAQPGLPEILVDEGRMQQVLKNLIENALRYTPQAGKIILGAHLKDGNISLSVQDSGYGIEAEDLPYVFDRFYRADKSRNVSTGKMGLGLSICKALVTAQGGQITAQSAGKDQGTLMSITLPPA